MIRKQKRRLLNREDGDPMTGAVNLVDAMLVIAIGLLVFLMIPNVQHMSLANASEELPVESIQNAPEVQMGQDVANVSQEGFVEVGRVYRDPNTGKLIMVE